MDTQGVMELMVLHGAVKLLPGLRYIKTEVADLESYSGCCTLKEISNFLFVCFASNQNVSSHRKKV